MDSFEVNKVLGGMWRGDPEVRFLGGIRPCTPCLRIHSHRHLSPHPNLFLLCYLAQCCPTLGS